MANLVIVDRPGSVVALAQADTADSLATSPGGCNIRCRQASKLWRARAQPILQRADEDGAQLQATRGSSRICMPSRHARTMDYKETVSPADAHELRALPIRTPQSGAIEDA